MMARKLKLSRYTKKHKRDKELKRESRSQKQVRDGPVGQTQGQNGIESQVSECQKSNPFMSYSSSPLQLQEGFRGFQTLEGQANHAPDSADGPFHGFQTQVKVMFFPARKKCPFSTKEFVGMMRVCQCCKRICKMIFRFRAESLPTPAMTSTLFRIPEASGTRP